MITIREIYKIGRGPSSSHTIGPERACKRFMQDFDMDQVKVILYGSLAKTGKGHGTDRVIVKTFEPIKCDIVMDEETVMDHPNTMDLIAFKDGKEIGQVRVKSVGGGDILYGDEKKKEFKQVYSENTFSEVAEYCKENDMELWEYVFEKEPDIEEYLYQVWEQMIKTMRAGVNDEGILPGGLELQKKAKLLRYAEHVDETPEVREERLICSYAFATSEQNASGETIVTAPTCGAAGILPAVLYYNQKRRHYTDEEIVHALATAGLVGNVIKTNASISGAEAGCQAEVGSACSMAAAALAQLYGLSIDKVEYAAEIALEHHLGLTCDPVCGLVQIPCIERNAVAAMRAINAVNLASLLWQTRKVSFDKIVTTMAETGRDLREPYRETSEGGLAKNY
ncbi:MAG: L-serine ammonia-lyase, iron-sulfur-dependent, subunit alpha [Clostridia bacterium]|nr:L-serine ammonia-lyase, iron-sulfur-dependent, subunit alpha [Clostridia bacterium]